jgi:mRNA-degrading endonuclease RelE of RelBE toxin-antitoxin system
VARISQQFKDFLNLVATIVGAGTEGHQRGQTGRRPDLAKGTCRQPEGEEAMTTTANRIYVRPDIGATLKSLDLSDDQMQELDAAAESLAQPATIPDSRIVFADDSESGGLRELDRNGFRILFRIDPKSSTVVVAGIRPKAETATVSGPRGKLVAAR